MGNNLQRLPEDEQDGAKNKRNKILHAQDKFIQTLMNSDEEESSEETDWQDEGPDEDDLEREGKGVEGLDDVDGPIVQMNLARCAPSSPVDLTKYDFPFENLVFEGGGNKGLAYCGAVRVLEALEDSELPPEKRTLPRKVKRFAGTSAGAMTAALLAVGYNSYDIQKFLSQNLSKIFLDHSWGYLSLLPNLIMGYGWNPGKRIFNWFGRALAARPKGHADITFAQVYERYGKELCVVVTNLNMMTTEYFHPKTTPDTPVRVAVRMSMGIPGLFQATQYANHRQENTGHRNTYVDGGVLCNYPIHCYDGWWLSMSSDSFFKKLRTLEDLPKMLVKTERFGTFNKATLGFALFSDDEADLLQVDLQKRVIPAAPFPDTELAKEKKQAKQRRDRAKRKHNRNLKAVKEFLKALGNSADIMNEQPQMEPAPNELQNGTERPAREAAEDKINISDLQRALVMIKEEDFRQLFGEGVTVEDATSALDENGDGQLSFTELLHFIERNGVSLQECFLSYQRKEIKGLYSFFDTLQSALLTNLRRLVIEERDIERTVGINTGHVGTSDFTLEEKDREYVVQQGVLATETFLRNYVEKFRPPLKSYQSGPAGTS